MMSTAGEFADVVGSTLEGQSEDAQVFSAKIPQRPTDLAQESLPLLLVNRADFLQESEVISSICSDSLECRNILGETGTAIADARKQEAATDARVAAYSVSDLLDIGSYLFADVRHRVHERDFHRQECV